MTNDELKNLRQLLGLSLADVSSVIGTSAAQISRYEAGTQKIPQVFKRAFLLEFGFDSPAGVEKGVDDEN